MMPNRNSIRSSIISAASLDLIIESTSSVKNMMVNIIPKMSLFLLPLPLAIIIDYQ